LTKPSTFAENVIVAIKDIFEGKDVSHSFFFPTEHLSNYAKGVIGVVSLIPPGYVASYGAVAKAAGGSLRSVGVMAMNPFLPICACHRVVGSDFSLVGYGGGLDVKLEILKREKRGYASKKEMFVGSKKLELHPVECVLRMLERDKR
jgi:methylated-DNA-[protein]-cysteine S-methyltransferase